MTVRARTAPQLERAIITLTPTPAPIIVSGMVRVFIQPIAVGVTQIPAVCRLAPLIVAIAVIISTVARVVTTARIAAVEHSGLR